MVTLELSTAARWVYVKASGFLDYWDDTSDMLYMATVISEARRSGLDAILYDGRNVSGELSRWKVAVNCYMMRQRLGGVRLAYVRSNKFVTPFDYSEQVAKSLGLPARGFWSLNEAECWLEKISTTESPRLVEGRDE